MEWQRLLNTAQLLGYYIHLYVHIYIYILYIYDIHNYVIFPKWGAKELLSFSQHDS